MDDCEDTSRKESIIGKSFALKMTVDQNREKLSGSRRSPKSTVAHLTAEGMAPGARKSSGRNETRNISARWHRRS